MLVMMSAVDDHDSCCGDSYNNYCENSHDCDDGLSDNKFKIFKNIMIKSLKYLIFLFGTSYKNFIIK